MSQTMSKEKLACLELSLISGIGMGQATKWSRQFGSITELMQRAAQKKEGLLAPMPPMPTMKEQVREKVEKAAEGWLKEEPSRRALEVMEQCRQQEIQWVTWADEEYPKLLRYIEDPPLVLYLRGRAEILEKICISIVGSRKASAYGQKVAYEVAAESAGAGCTVVSGLARGIDACAHKGALDVGGHTAAVMAGGLDLCYPRSNRWLYNRICETGLAVSEYPPGTGAEKWHFIERNRIVSGLSLATVVAQAGPKSGSIRTAQLAAEQGREVFGVPGNIYDLEYLGVHNLIQDGANVLTSVKGIVRWLQNQKEGSGEKAGSMVSEKKLGHKVDFAPKIHSAELVDESKLAEELQKKALKKREKAGEALWLYEVVGDFESLPEQLCQQTGRSAAEVQQAITILELKGLVKRGPRQQITRI